LRNDQAVDLLPIAGDFGGLCAGVDADVGQAPELVHQHGVGFQLGIELQQRDVLDDAGQVDGRFDAGIAAADHGHLPCP
jgi:hypothetical protein